MPKGPAGREAVADGSRQSARSWKASLQHRRRLKAALAAAALVVAALAVAGPAVADLAVAAVDLQGTHGSRAKPFL